MEQAARCRNHIPGAEGSARCLSLHETPSLRGRADWYISIGSGGL
jgi:hypothetical protein